MPPTTTLVLTVLLQLITTVAAAEVVLRIEPEIRGKNTVVPPDMAGRPLLADRTVALSKDQILISQDGSLGWIDLRSNQVCLGSADGRSGGFSILALVAFRDLEVRNRELMDRQMRRLKGVPLGPAAYPIVADEIELSTRAPELGDELSRGEIETLVYFRLDDRTWGAYSKERIEVDDPEAVALFAQYLRVFCSFHPDMLDELSTLDHIPRWVSSRVPQLELRELRLQIAVVDETVGRESKPTCFPLATDMLPPVRRLLGDAAELHEKASRSRAAEIRAEGIEAFEHGETFTGALCFLEFSSMRPESEHDWAKPWKDDMEDDPTYEELESLLDDASSPEQAKKMLRDLGPWKRRLGTRTHLADLWVGKLQLQAGRPMQAESSFASALQGNPMLIEAWGELAEGYWQRFDTFSALECLEVARRLAPEHDLVQSYFELAESLRESYPEYFRPLER